MISRINNQIYYLTSQNKDGSCPNQSQNTKKIKKAWRKQRRLRLFFPQARAKEHSAVYVKYPEFVGLMPLESV